MPTVLRLGPDRFFFYSGDRPEPPHVHVERGGCEAKFWLDPVSLARHRGYRAADLRDVEKLVRRHRDTLLKAWDDFFDA